MAINKISVHYEIHNFCLETIAKDGLVFDF